MEEQEILKAEEGKKESIALKPAKVKIVKVKVIEVGEKKNKKLVCECKHPDKEETIDISALKYEKNGKFVRIGLWVNIDEDNKLRKGSALTLLMRELEAKSPEELEGKEIFSTDDENGYLVFKGY